MKDLKYSNLKIDENHILVKMIDMENNEVLWECENKSFDLKEDCLIKDKDFKESENTL